MEIDIHKNDIGVRAFGISAVVALQAENPQNYASGYYPSTAFSRCPPKTVPTLFNCLTSAVLPFFPHHDLPPPSPNPSIEFSRPGRTVQPR